MHEKSIIKHSISQKLYYRARQNNLARISLFSQKGKRDFFARISVQNLSWRKEILKSLLAKSLFAGEKIFKKYNLRFSKEIIFLKISSRKLTRDFSRRDILWKISFPFGEKRFLKYYLGTDFWVEISKSRCKNKNNFIIHRIFAEHLSDIWMLNIKTTFNTRTKNQK